MGLSSEDMFRFSDIVESQEKIRVLLKKKMNEKR